MLIVAAPHLDPGHCVLTKTSEGPFVDTGIDYDDLPPFGRVYLAVSTVMDLAQLAGATPPEASRRREAYVTDLEARLDQALADIEGLRTANEALVAAGYQVREHTDDLVAQVPGGSVETVLRWVATAGSPESQRARARAAVAAESAEAAPRTTLIDKCQRYIDKEAPA